MLYFEYGLYYTVCTICVVLLVLVLLPIYLLITTFVFKCICDGSLIGSIITLIVIVSTPVAMWNLTEKNVAPIRDSFVKNFTPGIYKKEFCRDSGSFPIYIDSGVTEGMELCFPEEAKIKRTADAWFEKNRGLIMMDCLEKANPIYRHRCNDALEAYYKGMFPSNFKYATLEQMVESGRRSYGFAVGETRRGVY